MKKTIVLSMLLTTICVGITACGRQGDGGSEENASEENGDSNIITVAVSPETLPTIACVEEPLDELGYSMEVTEFDDFVMPNTALLEGTVECNWFQHEQYMDDYNEANGTDIVMIEPKIYAVKVGLFSEKYTSIDEIEEGARIAIADDASNRGRALKILEEAGVIKLSETPLDVDYDEVDIVENPLNLEFVKTDLNSLYSMMPETDMIIAACSLVDNNGGDATSAFYTSVDEDYAMGLSVEAGNENNPKIQALNEAFHSDEFRRNMEEEFPGVFTFIDETN